jgi:site-specific recombinase XerD
MFVLKTNQEVKLWIDWRNYLSSRSRDSQITYQCTLKLFLHCHNYQENTQKAADFVIAADQSAIHAFIASQVDRRLAPGTIKSRTAHLSAFFGFLHKFNYRPTRLLIEIPKNDEKRRPTRCLDFSVVLMRINQRLATETAEGLLVAAVYTVLFYGALRKSEMLALKVCDLELIDGITVLHIRRSKARKTAMVPISDDGAPVLWLWLKQLKAMAATGPESPLFAGFTYRMLKSRFWEDFHGTPHWARKTAITKMLDQGASLQETKAFSRLSSFKMVELYDGARIELKESAGLKLSFK